MGQNGSKSGNAHHQHQQQLIAPQPPPLPTFEGGKSKILSDEDILELKAKLPLRYKTSPKWFLLYSSSRDGLAINTFYNRTIDRGATILVIKDTKGNVFGGFSSESWKKSPVFYGSTDCFVFRLRPLPREFYHPSDYNKNFVYFNFGNPYNPYNGLGFGGQIGFFTFALTQEFETGFCKEKTITYADRDGNPPPALNGDSEGEFRVFEMECWGFPLSKQEELDLVYNQNARDAIRFQNVLNPEDNADLYLLSAVGLAGGSSDFVAEQTDEEKKIAHHKQLQKQQEEEEKKKKQQQQDQEEE